MKLENLQRYYPEEMPMGEGVQYFIDARGLDWFESLPLFTRAFSIAYEPETGVIRSYHADVSRLYPVGLDVTDVDEIPSDMKIDGKWMFDGSQILPVPVDDVALSLKEQVRLLKVAADAIAPLQDAVDLGIATDDETAALLAWKRYRVDVSRVDVNNPVWAEMPNI